MQLATPWWDYLFCTPEELQSILAPTPWELRETYSREVAGQWTAVLTLGG